MENETLDLGSSPRLRIVLDAIRKGAFCPEVARKIDSAIIGGLRNTLKQCKKKGVTLADVLKSRNCPHELQRLLRKIQGHDHFRLFAEANAASGPTDKDCVAGWIGGIVDKVMDQICLRVAVRQHFPMVEDVQAFADEVREHLHPLVECHVTKLAEDPDWVPKCAPKKGRVPVNPTVELMCLSLLGEPRK